jgi:hypothetical protein
VGVGAGVDDVAPLMNCTMAVIWVGVRVPVKEGILPLPLLTVPLMEVADSAFIATGGVAP